MRKHFKTVDAYVKQFPPKVQKTLGIIRRTLRTYVPGSVEAISYQIPTIKLEGRYVIYFAAFGSHIGFYPVPRGTAAFQKAIAKYRSGKGTLRFPHEKPIPFGMVKQMVNFRVRENEAKKKK